MTTSFDVEQEDMVQQQVEQVGDDGQIGQSLETATRQTVLRRSRREEGSIPLMLPSQYNPSGWSNLDVVPVSRYYTVVSRMADVVLGSILLLISLPVLIVAAIGIKLTNRGPAMFTQQRAGCCGRPFTMFKLRTMVTGTDDDAELFRDPRGCNGPTFKLKRDPRVTKIGWLLRRSSIDELPQLLNVIRGDMSLVGPRPLPLSEVRLDEFSERARLTVRPGMTGLWQVSGRGDVPYDEWIELDLYYVRHRSLWLDLQILLKTIPAVLSCRGAY